MIASLAPSQETWVEVEDTAWYTSGKEAIYTAGQPSFLRRTFGLIRHTMWGDPTLPYGNGVYTLPHRTPSGALVMGVSVLGAVAARSTDDGLTWTEYGSPEITPNLTPVDLVVFPPSPEAPLGRIIAAGYGGIATSDDDGLSWHPTPFYAGGGLAFTAWAAIRVTSGPFDGGHGGSVLAVVEGNGSGSGIFRSTDGLAWERVSTFPGQSRYQSQLLASPDGAVYLYETRTPSGNYHRGAPVWRTTDGGETWQSMGRIWDEWSAVPTGMAVGPDGRLWASMTGRSSDPTALLGGVFRTIDPVVAVTSEPASPEASGAVLRVTPNPASGAVRVALSLDSPEAVTLIVFDARGRAVHAAASGARGEHAWEVSTSGWAPGVYVVRAEAGGETVTAQMTVAR